MIYLTKEEEKRFAQIWDKVEQKLSLVAVRSYDKLPYTAHNGVHDDKKEKDVAWWTNGFWGGMMWLMYQETKKEVYRKTAEHSEELLDKALEQYDELHHDVGFMWHLLSGANYKITKNPAARNKNLFLASVLMSRYNVSGDYIRAWNYEFEGYSIIDCLMNLSLLYWASEEIGDTRFKKIAMRHMDMALRDHIRADGSVNHVVDHDPETGAVRQVLFGQGYRADTCWSRGLAWAVYGSVISYRYTQKEEYLDAAKRTANYFISHCEKTGYLPQIDFGQPQTPEYYDSTAGACTACGLLELSKYVSDEEAKYYTNAAIRILLALDERCCNYNRDEDPLMMMGSERYPQTEAMVKTVHMPIIYGDFFFVEALLKLRGNDFFIW